MNSKNLHGVVSIGGGTGLSCLLKGLKHRVLEPPIIEAPGVKPWIARLTAVVTVTDDGGSSGRLRNELQVLPPGDIRNCMVALSTDESLLSHLFQYRFRGSGQLQGHSFGNLFLTALTGVTGDFLEAIRVSSDVLAIKGKIYPATLSDVRLEAILEDGARLHGESLISKSRSRIASLCLTPPNCRPVPAVLDAIRKADLITVGPGSLFTSLLPNLLVPGIARALRKSPAMKVYICNLMSQPGETIGFTAADHVSAIYRHTGDQLFDWIILNNQPISRAVLARYRRQGSTPIVFDRGRIASLGLNIFEDALLARGRVVRHDPDRLAEAVYKAYKTRKDPSARAKEEVSAKP
jgi:uncharacterized cofD-like protein